MKQIRFLTFEEMAATFRGKRVALVGSGPSSRFHKPGFIDGHEVVVRVNNFKLSKEAGVRADVHYSYYGGAIDVTAAALQGAGVKLCVCKCPNSKPLNSPWHERNGHIRGIDFRWIYEYRRAFWFCDVFVPDDELFLNKFRLLRGHVPTTGFSALLDILSCGPSELYMTGFDFFTSGIHNVDERWKKGNPRDPIGHDNAAELQWVAENHFKYPLTFDSVLARLVDERASNEV